MELETKYNLGDKVWLISGNKAVEKIVTQFDIDVHRDESEITYELNYESAKIPEHKLFKSKEELLKSL